MMSRKWHAREINDPFDQATIDRFWSSVDRSGECWLWQKSCGDGGYGRACLNRIAHQAHRVSYAIAYGYCPADIRVCHTCDEPLCVNPAHLFLGTHARNMEDMVWKGRMPTGRQHGLCNASEKNFNAKLSDLQVAEIRNLRAQGMKIGELGLRYGVTKVTISQIANGKRRKNGQIGAHV